MPIISRFYGITVSMYFNDHQPPHIHLYYGDDEEILDIRDGRVMEGKLPRRAHKLVIEWWDEHRDELLDMWNTEDRGRKIAPLE